MQANITSSFAVNSELTHHLPRWFDEVLELGVPTRYSEDQKDKGQRTRIGLPRMLPVIVTDFDLEAGDQPLQNKAALPVHANHISSIDLLIRNSWVPDANAQLPDMAQDDERVEKAKRMQELYLPTGDGKLVLSLWPRVQALGQAHEMGRALGALDKESYLRFYGETGRGLGWDLVQKEVDLVNKRFNAYAEMLLAYGKCMTDGTPIGNLTRLHN